MHSLKFINKYAKINNQPDMNYGINYLEECSKFQFIKCPGCFLISPDSQHSSALWTFGCGTMERMRLKSVSSLTPVYLCHKIKACTGAPASAFSLLQSVKPELLRKILLWTGEQQMLEWQHGHFLIPWTALDCKLSVPCLPCLMGITIKKYKHYWPVPFNALCNSTHVESKFFIPYS